MLFIYTIIFFVSIIFYYLDVNILASVIMIALAVYIYISEYLRVKRIVNERGLFGLSFIGGFGLSLLKLSNLSKPYNFLTIMAIYCAFYFVYFGTFMYEKQSSKKVIKYKKFKLPTTTNALSNQDILIIVLFVATFISFIFECFKLKFVPLFAFDMPHAYSSFHIYGIHYITTFYVFLPPISVCNYYMSNKEKKDKIIIAVAFAYSLVLSILMLSRANLLKSIILSGFIYFMLNVGRVAIRLKKVYLDIKSFLFNKDKKTKNSLKFKGRYKKYLYIFVAVVLLLLVVFVVISINRRHSISYLQDIFDMKYHNMPVVFSQPYMYITHNYENFNYLVSNMFRWTFGRRSLYPFFTLTFIKKFFPIVVDAPYYIIKDELSTVTMIYDFYYDFGLVGVIVFCFLLGYVGKCLEKKVYGYIDNEGYKKNNYILLMFATFCYYMLFSFFQSYYSLTDTWVNYLFIGLLMIFVQMNKCDNNVKLERNEYEEKNSGVD